MIRTNLSTRPFYNERAVQLVAAGRSRARGRRGHGVQRHARASATRAATRELGDAGGARRGAGRASCARRRRALRASVDADADRRRVASTRAGQRPDRPPHVLVDRAVQPASRRRCPTTSASPSVRPTIDAGRGIVLHDHVVGAQRRRRRRSSWRTSSTPARSRDVLVARGARQRSRASSQATLEAMYQPSVGATPAGRRRSRRRRDDAAARAHRSREARRSSCRSRSALAGQRRRLRARRVSARRQVGRRRRSRARRPQARRRRAERDMAAAARAGHGQGARRRRS